MIMNISSRDGSATGLAQMSAAASNRSQLRGNEYQFAMKGDLMVKRVLGSTLALAFGLSGMAAIAQTPPAGPPCGVTGSSTVRVEGRAMLRLSDVAGCPGVRYEVIPGLRINGEPAVKLLPNEDGTGGGGSPSVRADGKGVARQGDAQ